MSTTVNITEQVFTIDIIDDDIVIDELDGINVYNEGTYVGTVRSIDFEGDSTSVSIEGTRAVITVSLDSTPDIIVQKVTVTAAELLAMQTTAKTLLAAPGAGYYLSILDVTVVMKPGNVAFNFEPNDFQYVGFEVVNVLTDLMPIWPLSDRDFGGTYVIMNDTSQRVFKLHYGPSVVFTYLLEMKENEPLILASRFNTNPPSQGNGTLEVVITYSINAI